jgi:hypothetical protein
MRPSSGHFPRRYPAEIAMVVMAMFQDYPIRPARFLDEAGESAEPMSSEPPKHEEHSGKSAATDDLVRVYLREMGAPSGFSPVRTKSIWPGESSGAACACKKHSPALPRSGRQPWPYSMMFGEA